MSSEGSRFVKPWCLAVTITIFAALGVVGLACRPASEPPEPPAREVLPVYLLAQPGVETDRAAEILHNLHDGPMPQEVRSEDRPDAVVRRAGSKEVEIYKASGGVWVRDRNELWNPTRRPDLPSQDQARELADRFLAENELPPARDERIDFGFAGYSETAVAEDGPEGAGGDDKTVLDVQVDYDTKVVVKRPDGETLSLPVVGGGGNFKVAIGDQGSIIGFTGVWRPIAQVESEEEILTKEEALEQFREMAGEARLVDSDAYLAYYSAPAFEEQTHLAPVWVVGGELEVGEERVPMRRTIIAATKYGPRPPDLPARIRTPDDKALPADPDERDTPEQVSWLRGLGETLLLVPPVAWAQLEAGTSWIGPSQGLTGSPANASGFVEGLVAAGWRKNFNWGEAAAFEADWRRDDDDWVDGADAVFYTGHANSAGWVLNNPEDTFLRFSEVQGGGGDLYGNTDIEWIVIAACGPHQSSHFTGNVGNAFDRWRGIFDGLHVFLGYGAVTFDNFSEGRRVVQLARGGWPIIDAWFRTAWEIQPLFNGELPPDGPVVFVTAMYAHMGDHATRNDHLWGMGPTVADPVGAGQRRTLIWSGT